MVYNFRLVSKCYKFFMLFHIDKIKVIYLLDISELNFRTGFIDI
jgi:hypothetical protein